MEQLKEKNQMITWDQRQVSVFELHGNDVMPCNVLFFFYNTFLKSNLKMSLWWITATWLSVIPVVCTAQYMNKHHDVYLDIKFEFPSPLFIFCIRLVQMDTTLPLTQTDTSCCTPTSCQRYWQPARCITLCGNVLKHYIIFWLFHNNCLDWMNSTQASRWCGLFSNFSMCCHLISLHKEKPLPS